MNLLANALKNALYDLAKPKGLKDPNVQTKKNARGEIVIALPDVPGPRPPGWPPPDERTLGR